jgi:hypothetical protein
MNTLKVFAAFTVALVFGPAPGPAQTVITSLPYTISTAGVYVLDQPLTYPSGTGNAITVKASNVTISLNGYGITNTSDQTKTSAVCIYANNVENVTVENGEIFGFYEGVLLNGPANGTNFNIGHIVQNLRLAYCIGYGIFLDYASNCVIQNCLLSSIGITGGGARFPGAIGIAIFSLNGGTRVYRCQVFNSVSYGFFTGTAGSQGSYLEQNVATTCPAGFGFLDMSEAYRDNASLGCTSSFIGGNDFGGNHSQ